MNGRQYKSLADASLIWHSVKKSCTFNQTDSSSQTAPLSRTVCPSCMVALQARNNSLVNLESYVARYGAAAE